jgi:hypothetical protein
MNIIYLECKLLGITKCGFDFIGMSGCRRCPLLPPLFYSNDCGGQFYSNEEQFPSATKCCNKYFFVVISPNLIPFFLNFSKITIYSLISLFSVHSVYWVMFICLILFFVSTTYKKYFFYTTMSDGTLHFVSLRWTQGFATFSNAYEFEHVAKCEKLQCSSKHSRKLCERCRHLCTSI